jgi:hypothetical protein
LKPLLITYLPINKEISQPQIASTEDPDLPKKQLSIIQRRDGSFFPVSIETMFSMVRDEITSNMSMPIVLSDKKDYLHEIFNFYSEVEERIVEDKSGILSTDWYKFMMATGNLDFYYDEYEELFKKLKDNLRNEIQFVDSQIQQLVMSFSSQMALTSKTLEKIDIRWKRDKGDLIELVKALCLLGAINNSTNNLTETEAYSVFGNLFGLELKRPWDIIKNKSKYQDKEYFLEELHGKFQEHISLIRKE